MTTLDGREARALEPYSDAPLPDGDVLFLLDGQQCFQVDGLADHWDEAGEQMLQVLSEVGARRVVLAVSRRGADLLRSDRAMWRSVHGCLQDHGVSVAPLQALRAA